MNVYLKIHSETRHQSNKHVGTRYIDVTRIAELREKTRPKLNAEGEYEKDQNGKNIEVVKVALIERYDPVYSTTHGEVHHYVEGTLATWAKKIDALRSALAGIDAAPKTAKK